MSDWSKFSSLRSRFFTICVNEPSESWTWRRSKSDLYSGKTMEIGEQRAQRIGKQRQGKSTGVPFERDEIGHNDCITAINNNNNNNNNCHNDDAHKGDSDKKKLANIFFNSKSFFNKSTKFLESIGKRTQVIDNLSDHSTGETSSGDEWQLIEPDEEEDCEMRIGSICEIENKTKQEFKQIKMSNINNNNYEKSRNKVYIDIDVSDPKQRLTPALIHLCTALYALVPIASMFVLISLLFMLFTRYYPITLIYFAYVILDRNTCNRGGRRWEPFYRSEFWKCLAAYFPIRLRHSTEFRLDPNENYLLNYHPHGIAAFGCVTSFATNGLDFSQIFPGITSRFMVHETSFCVPLLREVFMLRGDCSVNSKSLDFILEKKWRQSDSKNATGNLLALVGGGLAEADLSDQEVLTIVVANRKGFVKKALIHGANLIPCIAFGENSVYTKINLAPNSLLHKIQTHWYNLFKFKHPFYYGLSITGRKKLPGALPYKRPITVVMGDPIKVERIAEPTQEQVDELHSHYLNQLKELYASNRDLRHTFDQRLELV